jgi:hypothetical protein
MSIPPRGRNGAGLGKGSPGASECRHIVGFMCRERSDRSNNLLEREVIPANGGGSCA